MAARHSVSPVPLRTCEETGEHLGRVSHRRRATASAHFQKDSLQCLQASFSARPNRSRQSSLSLKKWGTLNRSHTPATVQWHETHASSSIREWARPSEEAALQPLETSLLGVLFMMCLGLGCSTARDGQFHRTEMRVVRAVYVTHHTVSLSLSTRGSFSGRQG